MLAVTKKKRKRQRKQPTRNIKSKVIQRQPPKVLPVTGLMVCLFLLCYILDKTVLTQQNPE